MATNLSKTKLAISSFNPLGNIETISKSIKQKKVDITSIERLPVELKTSSKGIQERITYIEDKTGKTFPLLTNNILSSQCEALDGNIENYIGMTQVPTGVIGPLKVIGSAAQGDYYIPLATSEGALVASYHRGAKACYIAGGVNSLCINEGVQRSPIFKFNNIADLGNFLIWTLQQVDTLKQIIHEHSKFASLIDIKSNIEGNNLTLIFEYHTGDAAGQNMVTICTEAVCQFLVAHAPITPNTWYLESNYSGDKKATVLSFTNVRGKKVVSEVVIPNQVVQDVLKSTVHNMCDYWLTSTLGTIQSGAIGAQGHVANGLTALFLATGQDVACIAEAATGITRMEATKDGDLYCSVTLPNLIVGTVGGGTGLHTQKECLTMMDCYGTGNAVKFAEICGALVICGELSIAAALSAGHFSNAHKVFGRKKTV
jgi:hydroxymethylglutaryl-CoA reductase (NADPH)